MNRRYNIGLLVATIIDSFSNSVSAGAMKAAKEAGVNLTIFPGKYAEITRAVIYDTVDYEYQHNVLFSYAAEGGFDYLIVALGTIGYTLDEEKKLAFMEQFKDTPSLVLATKIPGYDCMTFDNGQGMSEAVKALLAQGRKHICMMAGEFTNTECVQRFEAYKKTLIEAGAEYNDDMYENCSISFECRKEIYELLERNPDADGIVCINDRIAGEVCDLLKARGKVPGLDVAVVGYDDLPFCTEMNPPLATIRADGADLGAAAVKKAVAILDGDTSPVTDHPTKFIMRASASPVDLPPDSFSNSTESDLLKLSREHAEKIHNDNIFIRDSMMFGDTPKEGYANAMKQLYVLGAESGLIATLETPMVHHQDEPYHVSSKWLLRACSYGTDTVSIPEAEQPADIRTVFNNHFIHGYRRHTFVAAALYSSDTQYGIALLEPSSPAMFDELELITYQFSSAVRTLYILEAKEKLLASREKLLDELNSKSLALEQSSSTDSLTGVYNRRGFYKEAEILISRSSVGRFAVGYADMDDLKKVNDNYGHLEGDDAIKTVAACLRAVFGQTAIIGRIGGDEFIVLSDISEEPEGAYTQESIRAKRDDFVTRVNSSEEKPYRFGISLGLVFADLENSYDLKTSIDKADTLMYSEKAEKKAGRRTQ